MNKNKDADSIKAYQNSDEFKKAYVSYCKANDVRYKSYSETESKLIKEEFEDYCNIYNKNLELVKQVADDEIYNNSIDFCNFALDFNFNKFNKTFSNLALAEICKSYEKLGFIIIVSIREADKKMFNEFLAYYQIKNNKKMIEDVLSQYHKEEEEEEEEEGFKI